MPATRRVPAVRLLALGLLLLASTGRAGEREAASGRWFGLRPTLAERGLEVSVTAQLDHSTNLYGGLRRGSVLRRPFLAALEADGERLLGWRGLRGHASFQAHAGGDGAELVGDAQGFDNVDAEPFRQVAELWLEQRLFGETLRLKAGKSDAGSDFAHPEEAGEFLNSSAGYSPTILGFPTYPSPALGASAFLTPRPWLTLGAGLFAGGPGEPSSFRVAELGLLRARGGRRGRLALGAWGHSGTFPAFDGSLRRGTSGWYALAEQQLVSPRGEAGFALAAFAQFGRADRRLSAVDRHLSLGLAATGPLPGRPRDTAGALWSQVRSSASCPEAGAGRSESALELYYGIRLRPWLSVKPDLQYVVRPDAHAGPNAFVATVRASVSF